MSSNKKQQRQEQALKAPEEIPAEPGPAENAMAYFAEAPAVAAAEIPEIQASENSAICGIGGCTTVQEDPLVMKRHKERVHNVPATRNRNQPQSRNAEVRLA